MRLLMLIALLLGGCATDFRYKEPNTASYRSDPNYSLAMNVLMASGIVDNPKLAPVKDIPPGENLAKSMDHEPGYYYKLNLPDIDKIDASHPWLASTELGLLSSGAISPPPGIGIGPAVALGALWLLSGSSDNDPRKTHGDHPLSVPLLIAWIDSPREWFGNWTKAVLDALKNEDIAPYKAETVHRVEFRLKAPFYWRKKWVDVTLENDDAWGIVKITGGTCWKGDNFCFYYPRRLIRELPVDTKISLVWPLNSPPDFISGNKRLVLLEIAPYDLIRDKGKQIRIIRSNSQINDPNFPFFTLFKGISARLPDSYFIYLPPGISLGPGKGKTNYPVILNRGQELKFIQPVSYGRPQLRAIEKAAPGS